MTQKQGAADQKRAQAWVGVVCGAALAVLFGFVLGPFLRAMRSAFPAADDFVYATKTHASWLQTHSLPHVLVDAWRYAAQIYRTWQGTFTGALVMSLHPAVFDLHAYWLHVPVLLSVFLLGNLWTVRALCRRLMAPSRLVHWTAFGALTAAQLAGMPSVQEGIFWYNSAWLYTFAHSVLLGAVPLALALPNLRGGRRMAGHIALAGLAAFLGMSNFITAMQATCLMALWFTYNLVTDKKRALTLLPGLILLAVGLALAATAPGNAVRLEVDGRFHAREPWLLISAWETFKAAGRLFGQTLGNRAALLGLAGLLLLGAHQGISSKPRQLLLLALTAFAVLCAMIFPHMYSSGFAGTPRVQNLYFFSIVLAGGGLAAGLGGCLKARKAAVGALAAAMLFAAVLFGTPGSYHTLRDEIRTGGVSTYQAEMRQLFDQLEQAAPDSDVVVIAPADLPESIGVAPVVADPAAWRNEAVADYFGLHSVRSTGATE